MITGMHAMLFSDPVATREFLRDRLGLPAIDTGGGWLIFKAPPSDIGAHPSDGPKHEISFSCDDLDATMSELTEQGVEFVGEVTDEDWGTWARFLLPGVGEVDLYQPKYTLAWCPAS